MYKNQGNFKGNMYKNQGKARSNNTAVKMKIQTEPTNLIKINPVSKQKDYWRQS
jgi:hypothetical protein